MSNPLKIFLSHNSADKPMVKNLAVRLRAENFCIWFDEWDLAVGEKWQVGLEKALSDCGVFVIFLGKEGIGPWHEAEMRVALSRNIAKKDLHIIPVILPDISDEALDKLPVFLKEYNMVRFHQTLEDTKAFKRLLAGIRNEKPGLNVDVENLANPYRGLQYFDTEHADFFFGREAVTQILLNHIQPTEPLQLSTEDSEPRFLAVIGASGSGKSSLVRAGLLASLEQGVFFDSEQWLQLTLKPGEKPLQSLAVAINAHNDLDSRCDTSELIEKFRNEPSQLHYLGLESLHGDDKAYLLILVDQFEEVFSLCHDRENREAFLDNLLSAATDSTGRIIIILTMRADFYANCSAYPQLSRCLEHQQYLLNPMDEAELREAIVFPARRMGCELESGLVELIVKDVQEQPGTLPLLQYALMQLWEQRQSRTLRLVDYQQFGGLAGALEQRANQIYAGFSTELQEKCQLVFRRLVQPGEGMVDTRRRSRLDEFEGDESAQRIIRVLTDARLLTTQREGGVAFVEVSHEALIRSWSLLKDWIDDSREQLRLQHQISGAARDWDGHGREDSWLWTGARLLAAEEWLDSKQDANSVEECFVLSSVLLKNTEEKRELRQKRRLKWFSVGTAFFGILMLIVAYFATNKMIEAEDNQLSSNYNLAKVFEEKARSKIEDLYKNNEKINHSKTLEELAFYKALKSKLLKEAFLYTLDAQANKLPNGKPLGDSKLLSELLVLGTEEFLSRDELTRISYREIGDIIDVQVSPSGEYISVISSDGKVRLWDTVSGDMVSEINSQDGEIITLAFNSDNKIIFSGSEGGVVSAWNIETGNKISNLTTNSKAINNIVYLKDEDLLIFSSDNGYVYFLSLKSNEVIKKINTGLNIEMMTYKNMNTLFFSKKTTGFSFSESVIYVFDVKSSRVIDELTCNQGTIENFYYSQGILTADNLFGSCVWRIGNLAEVSASVEKNDLKEMRIDKNLITVENDDFLVHSGSDRIEIFSKNDKELNKVIDQNLGKAKKVFFHPNNKFLFSLYESDRTIRLWDLRKYKKTKIKFSFEEKVKEENIVDFCYSSSLEEVFFLFSNGSIASFNLRTKINLFFYVNEGAGLISCSPKGDKFSYANKDNEIITIDILTGNIISEFKKHSIEIDILKYSPSGNALVSYANVSELDAIFTSDAQKIIPKQELFFWKLGDENSYKILNIKSIISDIAFHPEKNELATINDKLISVWDLEKGFVYKEFQMKSKKNTIDANPSSLVYSKNGEFIVIGLSENTMEVWDSESGYLLKSIDKYPSSTYSIANVFLSRKGTVYSLSSNGSAKVWDTNSGKVKNNYETNYPGIKKINFHSKDMKMTTIQSNTITFWDLTSPIYRLLYDFNPTDVANGLKFLWDIDSESLGYKDKYDGFKLSIYDDFYVVPGETKKYDSLLSMPNSGENKLDQLVSWLERRKAYRNTPAGMPEN